MQRLNEKKRQITEDLQWRSEAVSGTVRRLSLAVVAVVCVLLSTAAPQGGSWLWWQPKLMALAGSLALASLFADWCHALFGYWAVRVSWNWVHSNDFDPETHKVYVQGWAYRLSVGSFFAKLVLAPFGFLVLLVAVVPLVLR